IAALDVAKPAESIRACALKGRNRSHGPGTDQASLRLALDLHRQQQNLQDNNACQQHQRLVTRGYTSHTSSQLTVHDSKTRNMLVQESRWGKTLMCQIRQNLSLLDD